MAYWQLPAPTLQEVSTQMLFSIMRTSFTPCNVLLYHSHKKRKDSLETRAELAVLRTYVENHAILEPILLYRASNVNKLNSRAVRTAYGPTFLPFYKILVSFFHFSVKIQSKQDQAVL